MLRFSLSKSLKEVREMVLLLFEIGDRSSCLPAGRYSEVGISDLAFRSRPFKRDLGPIFNLQEDLRIG